MMTVISISLREKRPKHKMFTNGFPHPLAKRGKIRYNKYRIL